MTDVQVHEVLEPQAPPLQQPPTQPGPYRTQSPIAARRPARRAYPLRPRELLAALAFCVLFDVAFVYGGSYGIGGLGLATLFVGVPVALFFGARRRHDSRRLRAVALALALIAARSLVDPLPLAGLLGFVLLGAFAISLRRGADVPVLLLSAARTLLALPARFAGARAGVRRLLTALPGGRFNVLPLAVPLVLGVVFVSIFAAANPLVASACDAVFDMLGRIGLPSIGRMIVWAMTLVVGIALARPSVALRRRVDEAEDTSVATPTALQVARNTMITMNVVFALYLVLEAAHLGGAGMANATVTENQRLAHEGVFWLTVALAMLSGVVGIVFRGALAHDTRAELSRRAGYLWVALGLVLALATFVRIGMHIGRSGLSDYRIFGMLGTTLVVVGMVLVAHKLRRRRSFGWLVRRQLDAFAVALALYAVLPTHFIGAQVNTMRIEQGEVAPLLHVRAQAHQPESAVVLLPLLEHPEAIVRRGVAAALADAHDLLEEDAHRPGDALLGRNLLEPYVLRRLEEAHPTMLAILGDSDRGEALRQLTDLAMARPQEEPQERQRSTYR